MDWPASRRWLARTELFSVQMLLSKSTGRLQLRHGKHVAACSVERCRRCFFARGRVQLKHPWLGDRCTGGEWFTFCRVCRVKVTCKGQLLERHERSHQHTKRAAGECHVAPDVADFDEVLDAVLAGRAAGAKGLPRVGGCKKVNKMILCLDDAWKGRQQQLLSRCPCITLSRDSRAGRLCIRYAGVSTSERGRTSAHKGLLGWLPLEDSSAAGTLEATSKIITRFSTRRLAVAHRRKYIAKCRAHLRRHIRILVVDSAANETLCGELMRNPLQMQRLVPNGFLLLRDGAHGSRRLASRPFKAVKRLHGVVRRFAHCRKSPGQLIQFSHELRRLWKKCVQRSGFTAGISSLRAAKHRYESYQKPLGRCCLLLPALFMFLRLCLSKRSKIMKAAVWFLGWVTTARCILAAMMADAVDELMLVIRTLDVEEIPVEEIAGLLLRFLHRLLFLFGDRRGILDCTSYTAHVVRILSTRRFSWTMQGEVYSVGGAIRPDDLNDSFDAIRGFIKLCHEECRAEFPDFGTIQSCRIWHASSLDEFSRLQRHGCASTQAELYEDVLRFAQFSQVDGDLLLQQYRLMAVYSVTHGNLLPLLQSGDSVGLWDAIVRQLFDEGREGHYTVLLKAFRHWRALRCGSTSGIECSFTKVQLRVSSRQLRATLCLEEALARLVQDAPGMSSKGRSCLCKAAQRSWRKHGFGVVRSSGSKHRAPRADVGQKRVVDDGEAGSLSTEAAFLKRRRREAFAAASVSEVPLTAAAIASEVSALVSSATTTEAYQREVSFVDSKVASRKRQAVREGLLLRDEVDAPLQAAAAAEERNILKREQARARAHVAKASANVGVSAPPSLHDRHVFLCGDEAELAERLPLRALRVWDPLEAHFVSMSVPPRHLDPRQLSHWCVALRGLYVLCGIGAGNASSVSWKYDAAVAHKREVWVSVRFAQKHADVAAVVRRCALLGPVPYSCLADGEASKSISCWTFLAGIDEFLARKSMRSHVANACVVGLVTSQCKSDPRLAGRKHLMDGKQFLNFIAKPIGAESYFGTQ